MKNMWRLTRVQLMELIGLNKALKSGSGKKLAQWVLMAAVICLLLPFAFGVYLIMMAYGMNAMGMIDAFPVMALGVSCMLSLITTIPKTKGVLFGFKDYDMVMSLPVSTRAVVGSRMGALIFMDLLFAAEIMVPAGAIYAYFASPGVGFYVAFTITLLAAPLVPVVLGVILGALAARVSAKFKRLKFVQIIIMSVAVMIPLSISFIPSDQMESTITNAGLAISNAMQRIYPLAWLYTPAVTGPDALATLGFVGISVALLAAFTLVISRFYKSMNTRITAVATRGNYVLRSRENRSPMRAMISKELKRYFSSTLYVFNTAFGMIMLLIAAGALIIFRNDVSSYLAVFGTMLPFPIESFVPPMAALIISMMVGTVNITGCSISLEGKALWILKTAPQPAWRVLMAKLMVNLVVSVPVSLIVSVVASVVLNVSLGGAAIIILMPVSVAVFMSCFGLLYNLKIHRFDWTNEAAIIKQSSGSAIPILVGMFTCMAAMVLLFVLPDVPIAAITTALFAVSGIVMAYIIKARGERMVRAL